ncbi:MAG: glycosyl transferase family 2 [Chitinophagaceae bacterium]|nr:glycosyl transferase family 2 [Chitinophagaceae bacterium]
MENQVKISVIICSYNREDYIINAIDSLFHQSQAHTDYEVIVVDNNSSDHTPQLCKEYISVHPGYHIIYTTETKQGASFARNKGAGIAKGALLAFMDDDAIAGKDFIERILNFFQEHPDVNGLGGRIIPKYIPAEPEWMSYYVSSLVGNFDYSPKLEIFKAGKYPLESNMVVRKKDFEMVGGFNTALPGVQGTLRIGGEGKDFFLKLQARGAVIYYDPDLRVQHVVEVKKLTAKYLYHIASGIGRGERVRTKAISPFAYFKKIFEYLYKLAGSIVLGMIYTFQGHPSKAMPVINFRINALKGLFNR